MIGVYIKNGKHKGARGWLFTIDGRTAEVVTRNGIIRVDHDVIKPLSQANTFDEIDNYAEAYLKGELKSIVERVEKLNEDMAAIKADIKEVYKDAKGEGFDVKTLKDIIKMRKKDKDELAEVDELVKLYRSALDM